MTGDKAHQRTQESKIPREARRLIDFLNSRRRGEKPDGLSDTDAAAAVIKTLGIDAVVLDAFALERLRRLRDAMTELADRESDDRGRNRAWNRVDDIASAAPTLVRFSPDGATTIVPAGAGIVAVIGSLVADLHTLVQKGQFTRVRLCANEPCSHAFYDTTRSRTQRWHSYAVCGNRSNVAAHRRRADRS
ncbi:MAG: CGNR zinc finger domain-containing protein [Mycobacterium sp.]